MRQTKLILRIVAAACILLSAPLALIKLPWLPATVQRYFALRRESAAGGSRSYQEDVERRREATGTALQLYVLSLVSIGGLGLIAADITPWWVRAGLWSVTALTGFRIADFERTYFVAASTRPEYVLIAVRTPIGIAIVACLAALLTLLQSCEKAPPVARSAANS